MGNILAKRFRAEDRGVPSVTTGLFSCGTREHEWNVTEFKEILASNDFIGSTEFHWRIKNILGGNFDWSFRLEPRKLDNENWLCVRWTLNRIGRSSMLTWPYSIPESATHKISISVKDKLGQDFVVNTSGVENLWPGESRFIYLIKRDTNLRDLPLVGSTITADITLEFFTTTALYSSRPPDNPTRILDEDDRVILVSPLERDLENADVILVSKDNVRKPVHSLVLSTVSQVLEVLLDEEEEDDNGKKMITLDKVSGTTLEVLHHFLYSGQLNPEWAQVDVVTELTDAAGEYEMDQLTEFLDSHVGAVVQKENALALLLLTSKYEMQRARQAVLDWIRAQPLGVLVG